MSPIADITRLNKVRMTHQQIADLMLSEDRARRAALRRGDAEAAVRHDMELSKLAKLLEQAA